MILCTACDGHDGLYIPSLGSMAMAVDLPTVDSVVGSAVWLDRRGVAAKAFFLCPGGGFGFVVLLGAVSWSSRSLLAAKRSCIL